MNISPTKLLVYLINSSVYTIKPRKNADDFFVQKSPTLNILFSRATSLLALLLYPFMSPEVKEKPNPIYISHVNETNKCHRMEKHIQRNKGNEDKVVLVIRPSLTN